MTGVEHPTPTCPNCGSEKTRPIDDEWAACFDCDNNWMMLESVQEEVAEWYEREVDAETEREGVE